MSIKLDKEFTSDLNIETSQAFKDLKDQILQVLKTQYQDIAGFIGVSISVFRPGSIVTDYEVETSEINPEDVAKVNQKIPEAMKVVAPVIGSVTASYNDPFPLTIPSLTYTGQSMVLQCGPPAKNADVWQISNATWRFKGLVINGGRYTITTSNSKSELAVNRVILADSGLYECTLTGRVLNYIQTRTVLTSDIKQAPNIRVNATIYASCKSSTLSLGCCVQTGYSVSWYNASNELSTSVSSTDTDEYCIQHKPQINCNIAQPQIFTCKSNTKPEYQRTTTLTLFTEEIKCNDATYGSGRQGDESKASCPKGQVGFRTAVCESNSKWKPRTDTCIVEAVSELVTEAEDLTEAKVPAFAANLSQTVHAKREAISGSSATIQAIVNIVDTISNVSTSVSKPVMQNVLETVDILTEDNTEGQWQVLNSNKSSNASSKLLGALEIMSSNLDGYFSIQTQHILLNRTTFSHSYDAKLNSSINISIPDTQLTNVNITTIAFPFLKIMPPRDATFNINLLNTTDNETAASDVINAGGVVIKVDGVINNVILKYQKKNSSLTQDPHCVFWNFSLLGRLGAWDTEGCTFVSDINNTVTCQCNHLTSFSILMSTQVLQSRALDIITYIGVGISLGSLVICLIIEGYVWKAITRNSTALMRHVSIVNTALSLLIADICFMIAASVAKNPLENLNENYAVPIGPCSAATFFMHFFYLALFFWMLVSGLLLFYRTVMVFSHMSKSTMLAIGFCLGYGGPLIIAVVTVAATAPGHGYIRETQACWLNWDKTMAVLALVIPALTIVFINTIILFVVLYKMLRRGGISDTARADEKHTLRVIVRCVLILTPLFGLTWSLGVGTMVAPTNEGIHIAFAFFNSLQGLFILIFGTLFDSKIRAILSRNSSTPRPGSSSNRTRSTSGGISAFFSRIIGRSNVYQVSHTSSSSNNGPVESYSSI